MANTRHKKDTGALLTVPEVAERLDRSRWVVYDYIHAGKLRAVKVDGNFRVRESAVEEFLASKLVEVPFVPERAS